MKSTNLSYWNESQTTLKIPFWDPKKIHQGINLNKILNDVGKSGNYVVGYGDYIERFEGAFAKFCGMKYAVMSGSGTQALTLAYKSLGIGKGDEVVTTSHTFIATIDQIAQLGAKPILVDIGEDGLIDPIEIEKGITKKTKAIAVVHLEGNICKMKEIMEIARKYRLFVVEDACQAIGASYGPKGEIQCFSFYPAKILGGIGNAGMLVTNNKHFAAQARLLRANSLMGKNENMNAEYGWNLEPDTIQAAVLLEKLKILPKLIKRRKEVAEKYLTEINDFVIHGIKSLRLPIRNKDRVWQDFVIRMPTGIGRDKMVKFLNNHGIGVRGNAIIPNHNYKVLRKYKLPKTDIYLQTQLRIPCNPYLTDKEIDFIINTINKFYEKSSLQWDI